MPWNPFPELSLFGNREQQKAALAVAAENARRWKGTGGRLLVPGLGLLLGVATMYCLRTHASPLGVLAVVFAVILTVACGRYFRPAKRIRYELRRLLVEKGVAICLGCGYDLQGSVNGVCPECGEDLSQRSAP